MKKISRCDKILATIGLFIKVVDIKLYSRQLPRFIGFFLLSVLSLEGITLANILYVDNTLGSTDCVGTYDPSLGEGNRCGVVNTGQTGYATIQRAIDAAAIGDSIQVRQNTNPKAYQLPDIDNRYVVFAPGRNGITLESYPIELALLCGNRQPPDLEGQALRVNTCGNPGSPAVNENLVLISADNTIVRSLEVAYAHAANHSDGDGIRVEGRSNTIEYTKVHHNEWNITFEGEPSADYNTVRFNELYRTARGGGVTIRNNARYNLFANNLIHKLGYLDNGEENPVKKDHDGFAIIHAHCALDSEPCSFNEIRDNVILDVEEDGFDVTTPKNTIKRNIVLNPGDQGLKQFKRSSKDEVNNVMYVQNIVVNSGLTGVNEGGDNGLVLHNLITRLATHSGINVGVPEAGYEYVLPPRIINNLSFSNKANIQVPQSVTAILHNNWTNSTDPGVVSPQGMINTNLPDATIEEKLAYIRHQVHEVFQPQNPGPLIDAGLPTSYTNWRTGQQESVVSMGAGPDIGPFEAIVGAPICGAWDGQCPSGCGYDYDFNQADEDPDCSLDGALPPPPPPPGHALVISITGSGTVHSEPAGIQCGTDCLEYFSDGTLVSLTATPAAGFVFEGWSGDCSGTIPSCAFTISASQNASAIFVQPGLENDDPGDSIANSVQVVHSLVKPGDPANSRAAIKVGLPSADRIAISIYDRNGKHVKTVTDGNLGPGSYTFEWDGTNNSGQQVSSGSYSAIIKIGSKEHRRKLVVIK